jgi:hypothetical protein
MALVSASVAWANAGSGASVSEMAMKICFMGAIIRLDIVPDA